MSLTSVREQLEREQGEIGELANRLENLADACRYLGEADVGDELDRKVNLAWELYDAVGKALQDLPVP